MPIYRSDKTNGHFTQIANEAVRDPRLSYRALGILVRQLSQIDEWVMNANQLRTIDAGNSPVNGREGRDAIRSALCELSDAGYRVVRKDRNEAGQFSTVTEIHEIAETGSGKSGGGASGLPSDPDTGDQRRASGHSGDQALLEDHVEDHTEEQKNIETRNIKGEDHKNETSDCKEDDSNYTSSDIRGDCRTTSSHPEHDGTAVDGGFLAWERHGTRLLERSADDFFVRNHLRPLWLFLKGTAPLPEMFVRINGVKLCCQMAGFSEQELLRVGMEAEFRRISEVVETDRSLHRLWEEIGALRKRNR